VLTRVLRNSTAGEICFSRRAQHAGHQARVKRTPEILLDAKFQQESRGYRQYAALAEQSTRWHRPDKFRLGAPQEVN
jgi:hypothetical protein